MSEELNLGADWEQSKRLVVHWHNMWAKAQLEKEFVVQYLNPADTSFRRMIDNFAQLPKDTQQKLINLSEILAALEQKDER